MINEQNFNYIKPLIDLGMKPQEARIYLAAIKLGQSTVSKIAAEAGIQRTFVYNILEDMKRQGIVHSLEIRGKIHYCAISLDQFEKRQLAKFEKFSAILPELKSLEKTVGDRPKVQFLEGGEGIIAGLNDTLNQPNGSQILSFGTGEGFYESEPSFINEYLRKRIKKNISVRAIAPDNTINRDYVSHDKEQLRETILVPAQIYPFTNEINIYQNKLLILSLQGELLAVIIESESVAKTQRSFFELAWLGAQHINLNKSAFVPR